MVLEIVSIIVRFKHGEIALFKKRNTKIIYFKRNMDDYI